MPRYNQRGAGCKMGDKGRCVKHEGADQDGCMASPHGGEYFDLSLNKMVKAGKDTCMLEKYVQELYKPATRYGPGKKPAKSPKRVAGAKAAAAKNPWLAHVARFRADNPDMAYKDVLREAKKTYTPVKKAQAGGYYYVQRGAGCKMGPKKRCVHYEGEADLDGCMLSPRGESGKGAGRGKGRKCMLEKNVRKMYDVKMPATPKQVAAAKKAREAKAEKARAQAGGYLSQYGAGCRMGPKKRCVSYEGDADLDGCMLSPHGEKGQGRKCMLEKNVRKMYDVKMPATPKQVAAAKKAREAKAKKARAQAGGYYAWF